MDSSEFPKSVSFKREVIDNILEQSPIEKAAYSLSEELLEVLVGNDEWEKNEYGNRMQAWAFDPSTPNKDVARAVEILNEMKELEAGTSEDKHTAIQKLAEEIHSLISQR